MTKAILFDFDGVLTLDETGSQSICKYISRITKIDRAIFEKEYRKYNADLLTGKLKHEDVWGKICSAIGQDIDIKILYDSFINTPINLGMLELVQKLKDNDYKIAMVTDNKSDRIHSIVDYHEWDNLLDGIVVSAEVGSGKDQEDIFHKTFQILRVKPEECVFIDNKKENLVIPNNLGVIALFFDYEKNDVMKLANRLIEIGIEI